GQVLYIRREFDEAIVACAKALAIDQDFYNAHQYLYEIYCEKKLNDDAFAEVLKLGKAPGAASAGFSEEAQKAYQTNGMKGFWRWQLQRLRNLGGDHYDRAEILMRLGERDEALSELDQAWHEHEFDLAFVSVNPAFLSLHSDPRFIRLQGRMWTLPREL